MSTDIAQIREKVYQEIERLPSNRLAELYEFIRYFRLGIESVSKKATPDTNPILALAGSWDDFSEDDFDEFLGDTRQRRNHAFSRRRNDDPGLD